MKALVIKMVNYVDYVFWQKNFKNVGALSLTLIQLIISQIIKAIMILLK